MPASKTVGGTCNQHYGVSAVVPSLKDQRRHKTIVRSAALLFFADPKSLDTATIVLVFFLLNMVIFLLYYGGLKVGTLTHQSMQVPSCVVAYLFPSASIQNPECSYHWLLQLLQLVFGVQGLLCLE